MNEIINYESIGAGTTLVRDRERQTNLRIGLRDLVGMLLGALLGLLTLGW